jgi:hypothetical protein
LAWWTDETAWGSIQNTTSEPNKEALNISSEPVEEKSFISKFRDILAQAFAKVGITF